MDTAIPAQTIPMKSITIKDIQLQTRAGRKLPVARRFYIQVSVGSTSRSTKGAKETDNSTSWDNVFHFDGDDRSEVVVKVYQKHHIGKDKLVGSLEDTLGGMIGKLKEGVFEDAVRQDTSHESDILGITIKFAFTPLPYGEANAEERQAIDAVIRATDAVNPLGSTPGVVGLLDSTVDPITQAVSEIKELKNTWGVLLQRMELFNMIVADIAQIHPYASLAWSAISAASQVLINQADRDRRIIRLASAMRDAFTFLNDVEPLKAIKAHVGTVTLLVQQVTECGYFITEYAKQKNFWIRTVKHAMSMIDSRIAGYEDKFRELRAAFLEGVAVQTEITVVRMMNVVDDTAEAIVLDDMPYAIGARFQREKGCLPGTRETFLRDICDILNDPKEDAPRVCLLTGVAGSGKSAVAHSIARLYDEQKRLGSSFCFASTDVASRNPKNLFSTIARDLSDHDHHYKTALWSIVKGDRALRTSLSPMEQLERLIIEPSNRLRPIGPLVIVIDALDESGDRAQRRDLLRVTSEKFLALPSNLRLLITARPEDDILDALPRGPRIVHIPIGDIPQHLVDKDIETFISHSLRRYTAELESLWPDREWCQLLVRHSQHLFQWARTACNFIEGDGTVGFDPCERLEKLLQSAKVDGGHSLDKLYLTVLSQLFTTSDAQERFRTVMAITLALNKPLSLTSLSTLLRGNPNVRAIIKPMGSLLDGVHNEMKPIRPLHTSFRDFLLDATRSAIFYVAVQPQHSLRLGQALLACMRNMLKFNICDLKDSRIRNTAIPDLPSRINQNIPPHLAYSCQYWMHHLQLADHAPDLSNEVALFFKAFFPYWLEAISLLSLSSPLLSILSAIETCTILNKWTKDQEIATLASEASRFIQVFSPVLRESTPHLYLSAMTQTPSNSPLHQLWLSHLQKPITSGHTANWPAEIHTLHGHTDQVLSVAFSPDGIHAVSGSMDNSIRVWNTTTGQCVAGPLQGHSNYVCSVVYSPDGTHIVSGSWDGTIKIWNVATGQCVAGPLRGHTSGIYSVAYSPGGIHVISGSADRTIRVWDVATGQCVAGPFKGHTDQITSVAYSPDGTYAVSGSNDETLRVWNAGTGQCVVGPIQGHTDRVLSVAYSLDGTCIISGSMDKTIRIWSAGTGQPIEGSFQGHTDEIISIAYSPDGKQIISGSKDSTIRTWEATTGQPLAGPFQGHTNTVSSVAYSPDGTHIISGSTDKTIKIWNVAIGPLSAGLHLGPSDLVRAVAYSPDGTCFASGSKDGSICVWSTSTGQLVAGPSEGHTDDINSIAFSSDGKHVVSGSCDRTVRVWSAATCQPVLRPFKGHTDLVMSVVYSPDGSQIASGSMDDTIRIWDAITGQLVVGPFKGHTDGVRSIAYSPDGSHIVSGSDDNAIRVWNATTAQCVAGPFQGHTDWVTCVAYSPDGTSIVSSSNDNTIRVWNATTGHCLTGPFQGHTEPVKSVAYSPNGNHIVSGSRDKTIRIWDAASGQCVAGPYQGHMNYVCSVAYSPDGNHLVTGSFDRSVKVWRTEDLAVFHDLCEEDGWIYSSDVNCFGWVAPWNRNSLQLLPVHSLVISSNPTYQLDVSDKSFFGESWTSCWKSEPIT